MKYLNLFIVLLLVVCFGCSQGKRASFENNKRKFFPKEYPNAEEYNKLINNRIRNYKYNDNYNSILYEKKGLWYQFWGDQTILVTIKKEENVCSVRVNNGKYDYFIENIGECENKFKISNLEKILEFQEVVYFEDRKGYWYHDTWRLTKVLSGSYKMKDFYNAVDKGLVKETRLKVLKFFESQLGEKLIKEE